MVNICQHAPNARQNRRQTDDRVKRSDHLGQLRRCDPAPKERADERSCARDAGELYEDFWRKADGEEGREDAR